MRVITGSARGTRLAVPDGVQVRPTIERVKEAIFSAIQFELAGRVVLDLFAGSGQMGIEALSRGAQSCDFADSASAAIRVIEENIVRCGFEARAAVRQQSWIRFLQQTDRRYSLVFVDPPYRMELGLKVLNMLLSEGRLTDDAIVVCELQADRTLPDEVGTLLQTKNKKYGSSRVLFYVNRPPLQKGE